MDSVFSSLQEKAIPWKTILFGTGLTSACMICVRRFYVMKRKAELHEKRVQRQKSFRLTCDELLERLDRHKVSNNETEISLSEDENVEALAKALKSGEVTAKYVLNVYQYQAIDLHNGVNCLTDVVTEAEIWADELDSVSPSERGILHGIPVSLKELIPIQGYDCHIGRSELLDKPSPEDCVLVKVLKSAGAVPFVKTNLPQLSQSFETQNPICGRTLHVLDRTRTPGGSSGGEAALVAGGGSPIGIGTDLGGSIRLPAHYSGICGLKPTSRRLSQSKCGPGDGKTLLSSSMGPLSRDVSGLVLAMRALTSPMMSYLDPSVPPMPFNEQEYVDKRKLRIGYFVDNGLFTPLPPCQRAVHIAKNALEEMGHEVVEVELASGKDILEALLSVYVPSRGADRNKVDIDILKYDVVDSCISDMYRKNSFPELIVKLISFFLRSKDPYKSKFWSAWTEVRAAEKWWDITKRHQMFVTAYVHAWRESGLDALICPASGYIAMPHGTTYLDGAAFTYTRLYNMLDFPAGVVPVTRVNAEDMEMMTSYPRHSDYAAGHQAMINAEGLPVGMQVVTLPFQEERCLRIMKEIETNTSFR